MLILWEMDLIIPYSSIQDRYGISITIRGKKGNQMMRKYNISTCEAALRMVLEWLWYDMISSFTFRYSLGVRGWKCLFFPFFLIITHSLLRAEHFTTMIDSTNKVADYEASMSEIIWIQLWSFNLIFGNTCRNSMDQIREHLRMRPSAGERLNPMHPQLKWEPCYFTKYVIISWWFQWLSERISQFL